MNEKILILSSVSAVLYGFWGSLIAVSLRFGMNPSSAGLIVYFAASLIGYVFSIKRTIMPRKEWIISGLLFALANYSLFSIMKYGYLSSAYVYVPSSILVFYLISFKKNKPKKKETVRVSVAVLLITVGMIISQINGPSSINLLDLGVGVMIAMLYGVSSYLTAYSSLHGSEMVETFWITLFEIAVFLPLALLTGPKFTAEGTILGAFAGMCVSFGLYLELASYNISLLIGDRFKLMNLINVLTNLDSVFIAIASVLLGSFTNFSLAGLLLVFIGAGFFFR